MWRRSMVSQSAHENYFGKGDWEMQRKIVFLILFLIGFMSYADDDSVKIYENYKEAKLASLKEMVADKDMTSEDKEIVKVFKEQVDDFNTVLMSLTVVYNKDSFHTELRPYYNY